MSQVRISSIVIGARARRSVGDVSDLAESMEKVGLLNPITVDGEMRLIAGARRLAAADDLGWAFIEARQVASLDDAVLALTAERDENTCRVPFTPSELVALGRQIEDLERPAAEERKASTQAKPGSRVGEGNLPAPTATGRTTEKVASALGTSRRTYEKARKVVATAEDPTTPEPVREVARQAVEEMDRTGKVDPAAKAVTAAERYQELLGRFPFMAAVPVDERAETLAAAEQLAAMHGRPDYGKRLDAFERWCATSSQRRQRLADEAPRREAEQAIDAARTALGKLPAVLDRLDTHADHFDPAGDPTDWQMLIDLCRAGLAKAERLLAPKKLRSVK